MEDRGTYNEAGPGPQAGTNDLLDARRPPSPGRRSFRASFPWALVLLSYWATYAGAILLSSSFSWWAALLWATVGIVPEAVLAPAALAVSRKHPFDRTSRLRFALVHAAGALVFVAVSFAWVMLTWSVDRRLTTGKWEIPPSTGAVVWREVMTLLVYAAVCSVGQASAFAQRAREETERAMRAEALRAKAQLASLRAQLNPHFILNLLHSLLGLVSRNPQLAASALERLGDVLRYVLRVQHQDDDEVPFSEEWAFVNDYLSLERLRLGDRLRATLEADPETRMVRLPAFILQPLVENAVRHAVAPRAEGGRVLVTARCEAGCLRLTVEDDGDGAGGGARRPGTTDGAAGGAAGPSIGGPAVEDAVAARRDSRDREGTWSRGGGGRVVDPRDARTSGSGLGLTLARERLAALYGDRARLRTGVSTLGGFVAEITLPLSGPIGEDGL